MGSLKISGLRVFFGGETATESLNSSPVKSIGKPSSLQKNSAGSKSEHFCGRTAADLSREAQQFDNAQHLYRSGS